MKLIINEKMDDITISCIRGRQMEAFIFMLVPNALMVNKTSTQFVTCIKS